MRLIAVILFAALINAVEFDSIMLPITCSGKTLEVKYYGEIQIGKNAGPDFVVYKIQPIGISGWSMWIYDGRNPMDYEDETTLKEVNLKMFGKIEKFKVNKSKNGIIHLFGYTNAGKWSEMNSNGEMVEGTVDRKLQINIAVKDVKDADGIENWIWLQWHDIK